MSIEKQSPEEVKIEENGRFLMRVYGIGYGLGDCLNDIPGIECIASPGSTAPADASSLTEVVDMNLLEEQQPGYVVPFHSVEEVNISVRDVRGRALLNLC